MVEYNDDAWGRVLSVTGFLAATLGTIQPFRYRGYVYGVEEYLGDKTWESISTLNERRTGIRLRFDQGVNPEVRDAIIAFVNWLRSIYFFPVRVPIYIKKAPYIRAMDGEMVSATFFEPFSFSDEPYIRVSTGIYVEDIARYGHNFALQRILISVAHELTHYFQWINQINITDKGRERQAGFYACRLVRTFEEDTEPMYE